MQRLILQVANCIGNGQMGSHLKKSFAKKKTMGIPLGENAHYLFGRCVIGLIKNMISAMLVLLNTKRGCFGTR